MEVILYNVHVIVWLLLFTCFVHMCKDYSNYTCLVFWIFSTDEEAAASKRL